MRIVARNKKPFVMRAFRHWTPRYIKNRLGVMAYESLSPDKPWLTRRANEILESYLRPSDIGLEFGSGRSTVWFAKRLLMLTSVEHDLAWGDKVQKMLQSESIKNVTYKIVRMDRDEASGSDAAYVTVVQAFARHSLDFVLVDGIYREFCALQAIERIRPGGILVIDNANWYLPSNSKSPDSRTPSDGPRGEVWCRVYDLLRNWRRIWTSSGVTDTAIFISPCNAGRVSAT